MDEQTAGRLELTGARARALFGGRSGEGGPGSLENAGDGQGPPGERDAALLANHIALQSTSGLSADAAKAIAADLVSRARAAVEKLEASTGDAALTDEDRDALESVIYVRGRPAVRVLGGRLESLDLHPGSDLWQIFIAHYEDAMVDAASATGAVFVKAPETQHQAWLQGSAWLVAPDRVVTNRHVVLAPASHPGVRLIAPDGNGAPRLRTDLSVDLAFDADDHGTAPSVRRKVTAVLYVSTDSDPVDVAVLAIEPATNKPLRLIAEEADMPSDLFVVGHPGWMATVPDKVQAVFGRPDGHKRVSFGKRLGTGGRIGILGHDASTVGGYSGGPVVGIKGDAVAGLHYYGDPANGNFAVTADALRAHASFQFFGAQP